MAEITEAQARRICEALGVAPDFRMVVERRQRMPALGGAIELSLVVMPAWQVAQRAAAEGGEK